MVSDKKIQMVNELKKEARSYPVIGLLDMHKLPARQLYQIRNKLRGQATIKMMKKIVIERAFDNSELEEMSRYIQGQPALLFSHTNPFKLAGIILKSKSSAPAKAGDTAPGDIVVKAGATSLPPGPVIGELQRAKIPATIEGDKISIKADTLVARKGETIQKNIADILGKLGVEPIEIGLTLVAAWDSGTIYTKGILFVPQEAYVGNIKEAYAAAFSLSVSIGYPTKENMAALLSRAHASAAALAENTGIITKDTVTPLIARAYGTAKHLKDKLKIEEETEERG